MIQKARTFFKIKRDEGAVQALLAAGSDVFPSPYAERLGFTRDFFNQLSDAPPSWKTRLRMWQRGFVPKSYFLYDFITYDVDDYISDLNEKTARQINKPSAEYLNNKQKFYELLDDRGFEDYLPTRYGSLSNGVLLGSGTDFISLLDDKDILIVKDQTGAAGNRVHICRSLAAGFSIDGDQHNPVSLREQIAKFDGYIVTEYCHQADYVKSIYPDTPNTIRIVTMNPTNDGPFVASSVHRIGTNTSGTVDNFSKGGMSAEINDDGTLGSAVRYMDGEISRYEYHPNTGSRISGVVVPHWRTIQETILSIATAIPEVTYVGWDVIVTNDGNFKIIEANSNTDTDLLQAHNPLLCDDRIREFYYENNVI